MGGNVGNVFDAFSYAIKKIGADFGKVLKVSNIYQSKPLPTNDGVLQDPYLNAALLLESESSPKDLLKGLLSIEESLGRDRKKSAHWGPRTIDLDLVCCSQGIVNLEDLKVPHPRMEERDFVLLPLRDILPNWVCPKTNRTLNELIGQLDEHSSFIEKVLGSIE